MNSYNYPKRAVKDKVLVKSIKKLTILKSFDIILL